MSPLTALLFASLVVPSSLPQAKPKVTSAYTDLRAATCKTIETDEEGGGSVQRCPGFAGYKLLVLEGDLRQTITVIDRGGKEHPLEFWHVITGAFSSLGHKAEWRVTRRNGRQEPTALIVRVYASEDPENPNRRTSYLAVTKITDTEICVTHKIKDGAAANTAARRAADSAASAQCLKTTP